MQNVQKSYIFHFLFNYFSCQNPELFHLITYVQQFGLCTYNLLDLIILWDFSALYEMILPLICQTKQPIFYLYYQLPVTAGLYSLSMESLASQVCCENLTPGGLLLIWQIKALSITYLAQQVIKHCKNLFIFCLKQSLYCNCV